MCVCIIYANRVACCCDFVPSAACRSELFVSKAGALYKNGQEIQLNTFSITQQDVETMLLKITTRFCNLRKGAPKVEANFDLNKMLGL